VTTKEISWTPSFATRVRAGTRCALCRQPVAPALVAIAAAGLGPVCRVCTCDMPDESAPLVAVADALARVGEGTGGTPR